MIGQAPGVVLGMNAGVKSKVSINFDTHWVFTGSSPPVLGSFELHLLDGSCSLIVRVVPKSWRKGGAVERYDW